MAGTGSSRLLGPSCAVLPFNSAIIPFAIGTMIVGALPVMGYQRLLSRWSPKGWTDLQRLGLAAGAVFFFALLFDPVLEISGRLGASVAGIGFAIIMLIPRKRVVLRATLIYPTTTLGSDLPQGVPSL